MNDLESLLRRGVLYLFLIGLMYPIMNILTYVFLRTAIYENVSIWVKAFFFIPHIILLYGLLSVVSRAFSKVAIERWYK